MYIGNINNISYIAKKIKMITVKEASRILCVEQVTIRHYITMGTGPEKEKLKAIMVMHGRRKEYRIKGEDLDYYRKKYLSLEKE